MKYDKQDVVLAMGNDKKAFERLYSPSTMICIRWAFT